MVVGLGSLPKSQFPAGLPRYSPTGSPTEGEMSEQLQGRVNWHQTMRLMQAAGINKPWETLLNWCARSLIEPTMTIIGRDDGPATDVAMPEGFWRIAEENGKGFDPLNGTIELRAGDRQGGLLRPPEIKNKQIVNLIDPQFPKDKLLALLPNVGAVELKSALEATGAWLGGKKNGPVIEPPAMQEPSRRGRKPDLERWQAFYFAAIELAQQRRLNPASFRSAAELKDELLQMMGKTPFDPDHAEPFVQQIYRKFVEGQ
jgi:hypothetical protein